MSADLSLLHLVMGSSPVVQMVLLVLLIASIISWTMIFNKWTDLKKARVEADAFERRFWSGADLGVLYKEVSAPQSVSHGLANIFQAGFREFARLRKQQGVGPITVVEGAQRSMRVALSREVDSLEMHLPFLATVGSISPYVGLFGTVWGIMSAFRALGDVHQATLGMVAPGIAEALIATAMGLFAAIPAVVGYNRYSNDVERLINHYDNFLEEFVSILQRQAHVPGTER